MRTSWIRTAKLGLAKAWPIGRGLTVALMLLAGGAVAAVAQGGVSQDIGLIKACADDVWRLCSRSLPLDVKSCMQRKMGQISSGCRNALLDAMAGQSFKICKNMNFALCASARCNVYNGVAYCKCERKSGDSISLAFQTGKDEDVCSVMAEGVQNQYMVSTYSLPESIIAPSGDSAIYNCPGGSSAGAYAQCDGGLCFTSTEGTRFPGFDQPVPKGQIICSCPISSAAANKGGYGILGPYPCQKSFFQYCKGAVANSRNGSTLFVGAPTGTAQALAAQLNGSVPPLNECRP